MKTVGIAGGSGFVGRHLAKLLVRNGYKVVIFSRGQQNDEPGVHFARWQPDQQTIDTNALAELDAMINLAGAGVLDKRWTPAYKQEILTSRTDAGYFLIDQLRAHAPKCKTYIASSATGIYGPDRPGESPFTEQSPPFGDFLASVCQQWEQTSHSAAPDYRTVILRFGIVLGRQSGAYPQLSGPMRFGIKPILGNGKQMVSWVHEDDVSAMVRYALEEDSLSGTYNCVAPHPLSHKALMDAIAKEKGGLKIPAPAPSFLMKILLGESSIEVLKSCTVSAEKIIATGFRFRYTKAPEAVRDLEH